jgi:hypothetical protein
MPAGFTGVPGAPGVTVLVVELDEKGDDFAPGIDHLPSL